VVCLGSSCTSGGRLGAWRRQGDRGRRALREQVQDAVTHQIDQDGAKASTASPRPLVHPNGLQVWRGGHQGRAYQPQKGRGAGREPQASGQASARLPAQGDADRPQDGDEPRGFAGGWRDKIRQALREDRACTGGLATHELPHDELEVNGAGAPGEVRQMALVAAMDSR
jgi:hypothetical protein